MTLNFQDDIQQIIMLKAILKTGVIVGTLDALAAIIILAKMNAVGVFQFIASGAFGKEAFSGGAAMTIIGILFHYLFAFSFTTLYFLLFPYATFLRKQKLVSGVLYGLFVWTVMNLIVRQASIQPATANVTK